jgi:hypothetical protein
MGKAFQEANLETLNSVDLKYNVSHAMLYKHVKKLSFGKKLGRLGTVFNKKQE